jgi:hypothetical protein
MFRAKASLWFGGLGAVLLCATAAAGQQPGNSSTSVIGPPALQNFQLQPQNPPAARNNALPQPQQAPPPTIAPPRPVTATPSTAVTQPQAAQPTPGAQSGRPPAATPTQTGRRLARPSPQQPAASTVPSQPAVQPQAAPAASAPQPAPEGPPPAAQEPAPISIPALPAPEEPSSIVDYWPWAAGFFVLALLGLVALRSRRRARLISAAAAEAENAEPVRPLVVRASQPQPSEAEQQARPWLELGLRAERASFTPDQALVQFELDVANVGASPARNVRIDVKIFNAGAEQDQEIGAFFRSAGRESARLNLPGVEAGVSGIIRGEVAMPVAEMRALRLDERLLYIPVIAVNALYDWGDGQTGQTSKSYVVGRELQEKKEKMGAFRVDQGPRVWRTVGQRQHKLARRL